MCTTTAAVIIMALPRNLMTIQTLCCVCIQKVTSYEKVADIKARWKINFVFLFYFMKMELSLQYVHCKSVLVPITSKYVKPAEYI